MAKKKEVDNLSKDNAMALAAGTSYGKWKISHPHTRGDVVLPVIKAKHCQICGSPITDGRRQKYCSWECAHQGQVLRNQESKMRARLKKQATYVVANKF